MSFYQLLANYYDDIFPLNSLTRAFLIKHFSKNNATKILDLACGSGNYSMALAQEGFNVTGLDLDAAMIQMASNKASSLKEKTSFPEFVQGDMLKLSNYFPKEFHGIFCIGNSLVHLNSEDKLKAGLIEVARVLKPGGVFIVQIVNYDRVLAQNIKELPPIIIKDKKISFRRFYNYVEKSNVIRFTGELSIEGQGSFRETVSLLPLTRKHFHLMLKETGFTYSSFWGTFSEEQWEPDSSATIVKAMLSGN